MGCDMCRCCDNYQLQKSDCDMSSVGVVMNTISSVGVVIYIRSSSDVVLICTESSIGVVICKYFSVEVVKYINSIIGLWYVATLLQRL